MDFSSSFSALRCKSGNSRYKLAKWTGLSEAYIHRLEHGERTGPSRDVVVMLALALTRGESSVEIWEVDDLLPCCRLRTAKATRRKVSWGHCLGG